MILKKNTNKLFYLIIYHYIWLKFKQDEGVHLIALKDISNYIEENFGQTGVGGADMWIVTPYMMYNKQQRRLNAELGINKINYYGNSNGNKNKKK